MTDTSKNVDHIPILNYVEIPTEWNESFLINDKQFPSGVKGKDLTRTIDLIIHNNPYSYSRDENTNAIHIEHQKKIINLIKGHEKEVLNDANVKYPYSRDYFNGITGTMSNILNSCFFILYKHGLINKVEVNVEDDICIIFMLLESINLNAMSQEEKESLNYIIKELKIKNSSHFLFNKTKWEEFIAYFNEQKKDFDGKTKSQQYKIFTTLPENIQDFLKVIDITLTRRYSQYEYGPIYLNEIADIKYEIKRLEAFINIKDIFLNTENNKLNIKSICNMLISYKSMPGGFNKKIIKRKKTKKLRNLKISNKKIIKIKKTNKSKRLKN